MVLFICLDSEKNEESTGSTTMMSVFFPLSHVVSVGLREKYPLKRLNFYIRPHFYADDFVPQVLYH